LHLLHESIKEKKVFKYYDKIQKINQNYNLGQPSLKIDNFNITQDDLNSLLEYEKIEYLLNSVKKRKGNILEVGAGSGRTAGTILALNQGIKYVIADIPPAINYSMNSIGQKFTDKKIGKGFLETNSDQLINSIEKNDVVFIFPHQIKMLPKKYFDLSIAVDCLHEMDKKTVKNYIHYFEKVSDMFYFKVWEFAGLPNSFFETYSIHNKKDYSIKDEWREIFKERCFFPANYYQAGYKF